MMLALAACSGAGEPPPAVPRADAARSTLIAEPPSATADGLDAVTLTATARDASGAPLADLVATFAVTGAATLSSSTAVTGADGAATVTLTSTAAGEKEVAVSIGGVAVAPHAVVTFTAGAPAFAGSSLAASPMWATAGGTPITLTARVGDEHGNPVPGQSVTFSSSDTAVFGQPTEVTGADGVATGSVSALEAGVQTISAHVGAVLVAQADVTFLGSTEPTYAIGGSVRGLTASGLVLATAGQTDLAIPAGATTFAFEQKVPAGTPYAVTPKAQPPGHTCTVSNSSGTVENGDVSDVVVDCVDALNLPPLTWTWVPIEGSMCGDGSPAGIGIEVGPGASPDVLVFLDAGGACWDYITCWYLHAAAWGPFGAAELQARVAAREGSVLDRSVLGNPFADYTFVFVPYCTGDVHSGATSMTYAPASQPWRHNGRVNVSNAFEYLASELRAPAKVVVSGSSAGGFGSFHAFTKAKAAWPTAKSYLVDDSGPPLASIPSATVAAWYASWDLGTVVADVCGEPCATDPPTLAPVIPALAAAYPRDRFALLSSTQDEVIRTFFTNPTTFQPMAPAVFEASLRELAAAIEDDSPETPPGETHAFLVSGTTHPMLDRFGSFSSEGVTLLEWLRRQVEDDPAWAAAIPR